MYAAYYCICIHVHKEKMFCHQERITDTRIVLCALVSPNTTLDSWFHYTGLLLASPFIFPLDNSFIVKKTAYHP